MREGPLFAYRALLTAGTLKGDEAQLLAAEKLQSLFYALKNYQPTRHGSWKERFGLARRNEEPPAGLYIFGAVGRGKSMLMDMFFSAAPPVRKRRVHFHEFMLEVHARLHALRNAEDKRVADLLPAIAGEIAENASLLCFDELHIVDIADAMLLGRLFQSLFELGVIIVATSNRAPDDLYAGGLQRELFLPFIALIKQKLDLLHLDGRMDYRLARLLGMKVYHVTLGPAAERALDQAFADLTENAPAAPASLDVLGRRVLVPKAARNVARFGFADLCSAALGAADYLAIAAAYRTVLISGIPRLKPEERNEATRFAALIDALYERRITLICSAEAAPQDIYPKGEHAFEFQRTISRLMEMQSVEYLAERR